MLAASQSYFHHKSENHCFPHIFGSSHHNQRIETWWSQFYRLKSSFIIDMLKDLVQYYNCDDELQKAMARYCFGPLIYFFPDSDVCDNSSPIIQEDVDVIFDFVNEYISENDKDDRAFIDYCDYVFRELILPLCSGFHTTKANFLRLLEVVV